MANLRSEPADAADSKAPSLDVDTSSHTVVLLARRSDDDPSILIGPGQQCIREALTGQKRSCEVCADCPPASSKKPRRVRSMLFEPLHCENGGRIDCIYYLNNTGIEERQHAIALWPQYFITYLGEEFGTRSWLFFHEDEAWFKNLLVAVAPRGAACSRKRARRFVALVRDKINGAIEEARLKHLQTTHVRARLGPRMLEPEYYSWKAKYYSWKAYRERSNALTIAINNYPALVLNHKIKSAICMDEDGVQFLKHVIVPLAVAASSPALTQVPLDAPDSPTRVCGGYGDSLQRKGLRTLPNIRDKVIFSELNRSWKLVVGNPKVPSIPHFPVGFDLESGTQDYFKAKLRQYRRAMTAWNMIDGSNRQRISAHRFLWHLLRRGDEETHHTSVVATELEQPDLPLSQSSSASSL